MNAILRQPSGASRAVSSLYAHGYRTWVLGVLFFGYVQNAIDRSVLGVLLEPIRLEFDVRDAP